MRLSFEKKYGIAFLLIVLAMPISIFYRQYNRPAYLSNAALVRHTHEVLHKSAEVFSILKDAHAAQLNFIITNDSDYLITYNSSEKIIYNRIAALKDLTKDNPAQGPKIDSLYLLISNSMYTAADYEPPAISTAARNFFIKKRNSDIANAGNIIAHIEQEENRLLLLRRKISTTTINHLNIGFYFLMGSIIIAIILLYFAIRHNQRKVNRFYNNEAKLKNEIKQKEGQFTQVFKLSATGMALVTPKGHWVDVNVSASTITGYTREELMKLSCKEILYAGGALVEEKYVEELLAGKRDIYQAEKRLLNKKGEPIRVLLAISVIGSNAAADRGPLLLYAIQDMTAIEIKEKQLKELNSLMQQRNNELDAINKGLAQFNHVISHDLKEPLRMIVSFMNILQKTYKDTLDEKANMYISFAVEGGKRMQKMIGDLLKHSRQEPNAADKEPVSFSALLKEVQMNLYNQIEERNTQIIVSTPFITIDVHKTEMLRLLQNLVSNAIKFSKKNMVPVIGISCIEQTADWLIAVNDNGIGIANADQHKIFDSFTRLHPSATYDGTGIGLSICKKIAGQHGGKIWVQSVPDEGSTFYITIAK